MEGGRKGGGPGGLSRVLSVLGIMSWLEVVREGGLRRSYLLLPRESSRSQLLKAAPADWNSGVDFSKYFKSNERLTAL